MEFWPIYVLLCSLLVILGKVRENYLGYVPTLAAIVAGVVSMRYTNLAVGDLQFFFGPIDAVAFYSIIVWAAVTAYVAIQGRFLVAFLLGISTIAYVPFMIANIPITRLSLPAYASDIPLVLAIMACGNGLFGNRIGGFIAGLGDFVSGLAYGKDMAKGQARVSKGYRG